jgi:hypothetical protein
MCSQTNTVSCRFPVAGESIKRTLKPRERIRQQRDKQDYGTKRFKGNYRLLNG